jgi:hypothetical protein
MVAKMRKEIGVFVSYAHADEEYVDPFLEAFREMVAPSRRYHFKFWSDQQILPGEDWKEEIGTALVRCTVGLLLLSPAFLASEYITEKELPALINQPGKLVLPVMLRRINPKLHDLKGLRESQIFRLKAGPRNYRSFAQCGSLQRDDFVYSLHEKVEARLRKM